VRTEDTLIDALASFGFGMFGLLLGTLPGAAVGMGLAALAGVALDTGAAVGAFIVGLATGIWFATCWERAL